jgi:hypothetical protein
MQMNDDDLANLCDLEQTIDEATEVLAAFISASASGDLPHENVLAVARKTCDDLAAWRKTLKEIVCGDDGGYGVH